MHTKAALPTSVGLVVLCLALAACGVNGPGGPRSASCAAHHDQLGVKVGDSLLRSGGLDPAMLAAVKRPSPSAEPPTPTRRWSNAAAWPGGRLPAAGDDVLIPEGEVVLLDVSPPSLGGLQVDGALVFSRTDLELSADHILVHGGLYVGSATQPFTDRAVITLTGEPGPDDGCLGRAYLAVMGGVLELYGDPSGPAWTRLTATAPAGATKVVVDDATGWRAGDRVALASTDYYSSEQASGTRRDRQVEERTLLAVNGNELTLDEPLAYLHFGETQAFAGPGSGQAVLDSRAEVARLTRNVTVQGGAHPDAPPGAGQGFGGQVMAMGDARVRLDSVELRRMGQAGTLMRYPVHFHLMGDAGLGSYLRNNSLHELYNRCVTIHGTGGVLLEGNAAVDTFGHCYFLEDGAEVGNVLRGNLALQVRKPLEKDALLPSDVAYLGPAAFWVTHPGNYLEDNVAASSEGTGFWYALPEHPTGPSHAIWDGAGVWPRRTPLGSFTGNLAHSNYVDGLHVDNGPRAKDLAPEASNYAPRTDPGDPASAPAPAVFLGYQAYKHRGAGAWFRGADTVLRSATLADNPVGVTFASRASGLEQSVLVGETANLGTPAAWEPTGPGGRSLPKPWAPAYAIRGFEFYDGPVFVTDSRFEAYEDRPDRPAGALSVLDYTNWAMSPLSFASGLSFAQGTNRVRFETRDMSGYDPTQRDAGEDGYRSAVFEDRDGSVTGVAGNHVAMVNQVLAGAECVPAPASWNAYVCAGRFVSLTYTDEGSSPRGFAPLELGRDGATHVMYGTPKGGPSVPNTHFRSIVPYGYEYRYDHAGPEAAVLSIHLGEAAPGDRMVVSLPYKETTGPLFVYRDWWIDPRGLLPSYGSLASLRAGSTAGWYLDEGAGRLYLLMLVQGGRDYARLTVCGRASC